MKFNFNKKMVSTIVILIFGVAITVAALSAKNIALENKTSSEIATEAVSATEMIQRLVMWIRILTKVQQLQKKRAKA